MALMIRWDKDFVIRTSNSFLKEVQEVIASGDDDVVIEIPIHIAERPLPKKLTRRVPDIDPEMVLSIRVITVTLDNGVRETLLTNLLDQTAFPVSDFQRLYAKRWGSESNYDVLKNVLEIENFTGKSALSIRQDFYATVLTHNIRGLIHWELQEEVEAENQSKERTYQYQLNTNLSIGRLKDRLVTLLLEQGDLHAFYTDLKQHIKRTMTPIRPGRNFPRTRKNRQKYTMTKKRAL